MFNEIKDKKDLEKFKRLNVTSFLSLALIIPHTYEDYRLHDSIINQSQLIDASVENVFRTPNTLKIRFYAHNLGYRIDGVFFKPRPFMLRAFAVGQRDYYFGKVESSAGHMQMTHPKKVSNMGEISAKYKTDLRNDSMQKLVKKYVSVENLLSEGLREDIAIALCDIHFNHTALSEEKKVYTMKYAEMYDYMQILRTKKRNFPALYSLHGDYQSWAKTLPFTLTDEQISAIEDIQKDLCSKNSARRMIVGDVGSGKTMVILASVVMATPNRSILMAPTTILANQLYEEAQRFLPHLKTTLVTNKTKKIDLNAFDFIIGTHALLYRDLPPSALVMVDEQHRFGTAQRNLLEKLFVEDKKRPHYIQFTATPIPRTQAMIDSAVIDVSTITTTPFIKDINTKVIRKENFSKLLEHIKQEVHEDKQVLIVYPLVEESEMINYQSISESRAYWEKNFDDVYVTHGKDKEKEQILMDFKEKGKVLIATTVVEVGISLPRLSTVVIVGAERLGLSTLHQLRGRVSRTGLKGYCYLFTHTKESSRLDDFTTTSNGFDIANLDLKYRQSGDLLVGREQSGRSFKWIDLSSDEVIVQEVKEAIGF